MMVELHPPDAEAVAAVPRLLAEEGVSTRSPAPTLGQWMAEIGEGLRNRVFGALDWVPDSGMVEIVLSVLLGIGAALLVAFLVMMLLRRRSAVPARASDAGEEIGSAVAAPAPADAAHWRARLESFLATGDRAGALDAMWSWLLSSLAGEAADVRPLAGRRVIGQLGRTDLLPLVRRLEAASYGGAMPSTAGLRELARRVEAVAEASG
ncbi:MAG TPA: hypothetical protein VMT85_15600 [Thermoanaerobaculia bacterium]|nr:hypothetical protein [Thermoanaerobaculia bacterium]